jgi:hypothetical protein
MASKAVEASRSGGLLTANQVERKMQAKLINSTKRSSNHSRC